MLENDKRTIHTAVGIKVGTARIFQKCGENLRIRFFIHFCTALMTNKILFKKIIL